jgi:hypothetical protein
MTVADEKHPGTGEPLAEIDQALGLTEVDCPHCGRPQTVTRERAERAVQDPVFCLQYRNERESV